MITIEKVTVVLIVLLVLVLGLGAQGCGDDEEEEGPAISPVLTQGVRHVDGEQWAELQGLLVTVTTAKRSSVYEYSRFGYDALKNKEQAPPGTEFIVIGVTVINTGDMAFDVSPKDFIIDDSTGNSFTYAVYIEDKSYPSITLLAGKTTSGRIPFLVPDWAEGLEVSYIGPGAASEPPTWMLKDIPE